MHASNPRESRQRRELTLGDLVAAVIEVADEREVTAVVAQLFRSGSVRLRRPFAAAALTRSEA